MVPVVPLFSAEH